MSVILLCLEGPMQSWGIGSKFIDRHTESEPSKSGVIGLISSALGRSRGENVSDLATMKMAVRVEREGQILYDYHTTLDVLRANARELTNCHTTLDLLRAKKKGKLPDSKLGTVISRRFYIADACFLVGFEGNDEYLLKNIIQSLKSPKWPLFLGRKSFPASSPICVSNQLINKPLIEIMKQYPWQGRENDKYPKSLRLVYECEPNEGEPRLDVPISFRSRKFSSRNVLTEFIPFESLAQEG